MKVIRSSELQFIPSSHEDQQNPNVLKKVLLQKADLLPGRVQMVNWAQLQPQKTFNAHYHEDMTEVFLIIHGKVTMTVADMDVIVEKGDAIVVEPGEVHTMTNMSDQPLEYIVFGISQETGGKTVVV
ncbi:MAG TPA: cupin domain-containing protein [Candidatus Levybacteria bacterium]|nr:cupin domain-containing protein [Candidatus Levybacteria bacterium]